MRKLALLACIALSGCAAQVVSSNDRSVVIKAGAGEIGKAQAAADSECQKSGRSAKLTLKPMPNQYVFECLN